MKLLSLFLLALPLLGGMCRNGMLEWKDAVIHVKHHDQDFDASLSNVISFGCIELTPDAVVVIHSFTEGTPDDYLVVPRGFTTKITWFRKEAPNEGKKVPSELRGVSPLVPMVPAAESHHAPRNTRHAIPDRGTLARKLAQFYEPLPRLPNYGEALQILSRPAERSKNARLPRR